MALRGLHVERDLRLRLLEATASEHGDWASVARVDDLRADYQHSVTLVRLTVDDIHATSWKENCHAFAFRLFDSPASLELTRGRIMFLLPLMRERPPGQLQDDDIVLYFNDGQDAPRHAGRIKGEVVRSKWSATGHVRQERTCGRTRGLTRQERSAPTFSIDAHQEPAEGPGAGLSRSVAISPGTSPKQSIGAMRSRVKRT
jgi:hypothetical protein